MGPEKQREYAKKSYQKNREKILELRKEKQAEDPEKFRARNKQQYQKHTDRVRKLHLWTFFRMTPEEWETVFSYQGRVCAITGTPPKTHRLSTDHNHRTGEIRGLLSINANKALAYFNDDPALLRKAADYLENPPVVKALGKRIFGIIGQAKHKKKMVYGSESGPIIVKRKKR